MFSAQETFNQVYLGLKSQGFQKSRNQDQCAYRGEYGRKCAAGHLIPDEHYSPILEGGVIVNDLDEISNRHQPAFKVTKLIMALGHDVSLASKLQNIHDLSYSPIDMMNRLEKFAKENNLQIPENND